MNIDPVIFSDGNNYFKKLSKKYIKHKRGFFILAPSGAGKTHFCKNQAESHWIDGDDLWMSAGAHPDFAWWKEPVEVINRVDKRSDVVTMEAKYEGFWVMGASNFWLPPDAIVIPDWETHKKFISHRHENNYDGGATPDDHSQVLGHMEVILQWHKKHGVPKFENISEAVEFLTKDQ